MTRAAIYVRVSTEEQTVENQLLALEDYCKSRGYEVVARYRDGETDHEAVEGSREGFGAMMAGARKREFTRVVVWALDRFTRRGPGPLLAILKEFERHGVGWESKEEPWASSNFGPDGFNEVLISFLGWVAKFERSRHRERMRAWVAKRKVLKLPVGRQKGAKDKRPRHRRSGRAPAPEFDSG